MHIPFHKPNLPNNLDKIFSNSIRNGWLTTGSVVNDFENRLMQFLSAKYVIAVNSCTAALHLALAARDFGKEDKFIVPTLTFASTVECGEYLGMEPILLDSEKDGFLIKLPEENILEALKFASRIKTNNELNEKKIIDLRINKKIILSNE